MPPSSYTGPYTRTDESHMRAALSLARRGLGQVAPNPAVGCVLVNQGWVVGRGWTRPGGRPHAETEALEQAGEKAQGATAYVTLEPCSHYGKTAPCADALIESGIARAVIAIEDPDARVAGRGISKLQSAGIAVDTGLLEQEARDLNKGFLLHRTENRPMVILKIASSLDGCIATANGDSRWITGPAARSHGHLLRMTSDAILVGIGTALADNPSLDCRLPGIQKKSIRVVLDRRGRLPETAKFNDGSHRSIQITSEECDIDLLSNVERISVPVSPSGQLCLTEVLYALAKRGITRLMVEGGGQVAASFLREGLVDTLYWYRSGLILGGDAIPAIGGVGLEHLCQAARFSITKEHWLGTDRLHVFQRNE